MAGIRRRFSTRLLLLVAIVCTCGFGSVEADATPRLLRSLARQDGTFSFDAKEGHPDTESKAALAKAEHSDTSTAHTTKEGASEAADPASHTANTEESSAKPHEEAEHKAEHEYPTVMMLVGPATAGVLAIILIGAVIAFKNRLNKQ
uniref:Uncharacterized protein n=1 Tax=Peronospora matthiolae TaxID=2874970 RepID=A0AAV1V744_9STRA